MPEGNHAPEAFSEGELRIEVKNIEEKVLDPQRQPNRWTEEKGGEVAEVEEPATPLRRSVGMKAFGDDGERSEWVAGLGEAERKREIQAFKDKVKGQLLGLYLTHQDDPSHLESEIRKCLVEISSEALISSFRIEVKPAWDKMKVTVHIDSKSYGGMDFESPFID